MKTEFKAKFLQNLVGKQNHGGFTLIELLVVIIIIGILSAIALPSFLNQSSKAKQSEAKQYVGSMNRAQQAYYLENADWGSTVNVLGLGIQTQTINYSYTVDTITGASTTSVYNYGAALKRPIRHYYGTVWLGTVTDTSEASTLAILCETKEAAKNNTGLGGLQTLSISARGCGSANWRSLEAR